MSKKKTMKNKSINSTNVVTSIYNFFSGLFLHVGLNC